MTVLAFFMSALFSACEKYNTDVVGTSFYPANSLVSRFTHPVYVEYSDSDVRIWGPYQHEVASQNSGTDLTITTMSDSIALIVYGYSRPDSLTTHDSSLRIITDQDVAVYLNNVSMRSSTGMPFEVECPSSVITYLVIPAKSVNRFHDTDTIPSPHCGCISVGGELYFTGIGQLNASSVCGNAISSVGTMVCNYATSVNASTVMGSALSTEGADIRLIKGTWKLYADDPDAIINTCGATVYLGDEAKLYLNDSLYVIPAEPEQP